MKNAAIIATICIIALSMYLLGRKERNIGYEMKQEELSARVVSIKAERDSISKRLIELGRSVSAYKASAAGVVKSVSLASHKRLDVLGAQIKPAAPLPEDTAVKCITYAEYRELITSHEVVPILDSIIMAQGAAIELHGQAWQKSDQIINGLTEQLELCEKENWRIRAWSTVKKWALIILPPVALVVGYMVGQK